MPVKITAKMEGVDKFLRTLKKQPDILLKSLSKGIFREGEQIMAESKRLVPVDEGVLRASGHVQLPVIKKNSVSVELGYGGPAGAGTNKEDVGYATFVHEDLTAFHTVGQAKYLEVPANQRRLGFAQRLRQFIAKDLSMVQ